MTKSWQLDGRSNVSGKFKGANGMLRNLVCWICTVPLSLCAVPALAAEGEAGDAPFSLKGYGTLGAVYHNAAGVEYRRDISQAVTGVNAGSVRFRQDSMLAIQADTREVNGWSASLQVVSREDADNDFTPQLSMAHVKCRSGDYLVRAGRLIIETYMEGDAAEVGYANLMVRQPLIFYPRYMDGVDAEFAHPVATGLLRIKGLAGKAVGRSVSDNGKYDISGSRLYGIGAEYGAGSWAVRGVTARMEMKNEIAEMAAGGQLSNALQSVPNRAALQDVLTMQRVLNVSTFEAAYDANGLQSHAGFTVTRSAGWSDKYSMFVNAGYRMGAFTPYTSYATSHAARAFIGTGIPDGLTSQADKLNQAVRVAEAAHLVNQTDLSIGVRYDFMRNKALKFQWNHIRYQDPENIVDTNLAAGDVAARGFKAMDLYSVVLDFVF